MENFSDIALLSILVLLGTACGITGTPTNISPPTPPTAVPPSSNVATNQVTIMVSQKDYQSGEEVRFTITNNSEKTIYYTYGCLWPIIYKLEDEDFIPLTINTDEAIPDIIELAPGETHRCAWDQQIWQDPDEAGPLRFQNYMELSPVPPGQYQFSLDYYFDEADVYSPEKAKTAHSQLFTIK